MGCGKPSRTAPSSSRSNARLNSVQVDPAVQRSRVVDSLMRRSAKEHQGVNRLLLLGTGCSGKSTLFKQMMTLYGPGFDAAARRDYIPLIHHNVFHAMILLAGQVDPTRLSEQSRLVRERLLDCASSISLVAPGARRPSLPSYDTLTLTTQWVRDLHALWHDPALQEVYRTQQDTLSLNVSIAYFMQKVLQLDSAAYLPTEQDIYRVRARTTGIVEHRFLIDDNEIDVIDVGGQRNERRKWIHCFENVTSVLFVAALSEYNQVLDEDGQTNRMVEALNLFDEICNMRWFHAHPAMILFLNKCDLFADKCQTVPIEAYFPEYQGGHSYDAGVQYFQHEFERRNRVPNKIIYTHVTCATDTQNVRRVLNAVKEIVVRRSLVDAGLQ